MKQASSKCEVWRGDITTLETDAIVNAANRHLTPGGGVCGAIHRTAGPELAAACLAAGGCPTGQARITPGFRLPARFVIHAVGPVWRGGEAGEADALRDAYRSSLDLASTHALRSIAFPAISTGIYGYPMRQAAEIAVTAVEEWLDEHPQFDQVLFAVFSEEAERAYREILSTR
jgi:O-acetyl-ADP-ribose deacetylase (regulator of RNase III)